MKKKFRFDKKIVGIVAAVLAALALIAGAWALWPMGGAENKKPTGPQTLSGYLICQKCGLAGKCGSIDLTAHPEKHTLKCCKEPDCIASGYGVSVKQPNGKYKFYTFNSNGSILALDGVIFATKKADNLAVQVRGTVNGDKIAVESVKEVNSEPAENEPGTTKPIGNAPATKPAATK